jgi:hypothetical protein
VAHAGKIPVVPKVLYRTRAASRRVIADRLSAVIADRLLTINKIKNQPVEFFRRFLEG